MLFLSIPKLYWIFVIAVSGNANEITPSFSIFFSSSYPNHHLIRVGLKLPGRPEFMAFMIKFDGWPHYKRLVSSLHCYILLVDESFSFYPGFLRVFLYLPGWLLLWRRFDGHHGMAFGPQHCLEHKIKFWGAIRKKFELFYLSKGCIFYAGTYTCHNLRSCSPEGSQMPTESAVSSTLSIHALVFHFNLRLCGILMHWWKQLSKIVTLSTISEWKNRLSIYLSIQW